jgi:HAD superfamily hydrolase (TIGR01509 family)
VALAGVLFDMDGLLVDSEPIWFEVEQEVMARLGGQWSQADQHQLVGGSLELACSYLLARASAEVASTTSEAEVGRWLVDGMVARLASRPLPLLPGALELLAEVAAAGLPRGLVTSSERAVMDAVLGRLDVTFDVTVCAGDVAATKPDPAPYLLAAAKLGAEPAECVALEDSPNGVASATAAGCPVVAVPSMLPVEPAPGRLVVSSLREVSVPSLAGLAGLAAG